MMPECRRALLIHGGALGDFVLTLTVVAGLRGAGIERITLLARGGIRPLAELVDGVDRILDLDTAGGHALFSEEASLPALLMAQLHDCDLAVDLMAGKDSPLGRRLRQAGVARVVHVDPRPRPKPVGHITAQWLADLRGVGVAGRPVPPRLPLPAAEMAAARQELAGRLSAGSGPIAILHPGSGGRAKCWPLPSFVEAAGRLAAQGVKAGFLLGPVESELLTPSELGALRAAGPTWENRTLRQAAALLAASDVVVGNDSGTSHLAAAVGARVVTIFGPTDPVVWRPLGAGVKVLHRPGPDSWPEVGEVVEAVVSSLS